MEKEKETPAEERTESTTEKVKEGEMIGQEVHTNTKGNEKVV